MVAYLDLLDHAVEPGADGGVADAVALGHLLEGARRQNEIADEFQLVGFQLRDPQRNILHGGISFRFWFVSIVYT